MIDQQDKQERLDALGQVIAEKRDEAVTHRQNSGIEDVWLKCEEAYLGIDDANRSEFAGAKWAKPTSIAGPLTSSRQLANDGKSTAFVRLTARYVDAGSAKLCEIALPIDDKAFAIEPTPVPDLVKAKQEIAQLVAGVHVPQPDEQPQNPMMAAVSGGAAAIPQKIKDAIEEKLEEAQKKAKKAEKRIYDWMVESKYAAQMHKVLHDAARIGTGVLKGPFPDIRKSSAMTATDGGIALQIEKKIVPCVSWRDPWNIFPAPGCGDDIHSGDHIFERDFLSTKKLRDLKKQGYIKASIDKVIKEGPGKIYAEGSNNPNDKKDKHRFEVWNFYGELSAEDMRSANPNADIKEDAESVYAIVTLVNDTVIRAVINPLDSGRFPFRVMNWQRRAGSWAGVGVAEQVDMPQRSCNAATRAMLNNAGLASGVQIVMDEGSIIPADGSRVITPNKIWLKSPDATVDDVRKAFATFTFPDMQAQIMNIIEYSFRLAEEASSIPLITQGQIGPTTPDTFGAAQLQNNNANTLLRSIANTLDDTVTEPLVRDLYEWLMLDPDIPDDEKGDFQINAHGSSALVERAIQDQAIQMIGQMVINPAFGIDPKKWFAEMLKSKRLDPRNFQYSEEEMAKQEQQQPPPPPQIQVAQIRAQADAQKTQAQIQADLQIAQMQNQTQQIRIKSDTDRDAVYVQAETNRDRVNATMRAEELRLKREIAYLELQVKKGIEVDTNKVKLADTAMKLRTQKELAAATMQSPQVIDPAMEPPGRAPNGMAFQR